MNQPLITVITVTYNCVSSIEGTMLSVLSQTYPDIEYIIIDGKSTDGTMDIVSKYKDRLATCISEPDKGIFDAMNKGIDHAKGRWIIFMNAGDKFVSETTIAEAFSHPIPENTGFVFGNIQTLQGDLNLTPFVYSKKRYTGMGICHQSIFVRADLAKQIKFDLNYKYAADYNMMRKIHSMGYGFVDVKIPICLFDLSGLTSRHRLDQINECCKICDAKYSFSYWKIYLWTMLQIWLKQHGIIRDGTVPEKMYGGDIVKV